MTKISLVGFGKMGKMLQEASTRYNCEVVSIIDPGCQDAYASICAEALALSEVAIDFTHPSVALDNIRAIASTGTHIVIGTTGWNQHLSEVEKLVEANNIGLIYGSNFSIGMNLFFRIVENAAKEFNRFDEYDVYGCELHHRQKADSPSGTAISLADIVVSNLDAKTTANYNKLDRKINQDEFHFASIRAGFIPGTHTIGFDSEADTIELIHRVRNRYCFAIGALKAARWIASKKGIFSFKDMVDEILC